MRWCSECRRYLPGYPHYCPSCGRTFSVRLCPRGHANPRHVAFCIECGSDTLSRPAPAEPKLEAILHRIPLFAGTLVAVTLTAAVLIIVVFYREEILLAVVAL